MFLPLRTLRIFLFNSAILASRRDLDLGCRLTGALVTGLVGTLIDSRRDSESFNCADIFSRSLHIECFFFLPKLGVADPDVRDIFSFNPKQAGGGSRIHPQAGSSLCCAETVSSRKLKLSDFYYILIGLNSEYKPVPWDIHCCHGNAIVEGCSVKFWLKSLHFSAKIVF